jgi:hypothetical protein
MLKHLQNGLAIADINDFLEYEQPRCLRQHDEKEQTRETDIGDTIQCS